jgi:hypothetical protein
LQAGGTTASGAGVAKLKRLRQIHHTIAKLLASGAKNQEVSAMTGMCPSRISILQNDPAFADLMDFYAEREDDRFVDVQNRLESAGLDAVSELHERVIEDPEALATGDLIDIAKLTLDRSGHSPVKKSESKKVILSGQDLADMKTAALQSAPIEGTVIRRDKKAQQSLGTILKGAPDVQQKALAGNSGPDGSIIVDAESVAVSETPGSPT